MTKVETGRVLAWFRHIVGLANWDITVTVGEPPDDLGGDICPDKRPNWLGRSLANIPYHKASIWINQETHKEKDGVSWNETETMIHELIHIMFNDCNIETNDDQGEFCINQLAAVLLNQYRADSG